MTYADYLQYLESAAWRALARDAKYRAGWRCSICNADEPLEAHHRTYARLGHEDPADLVALCAACHERNSAVFAQLERQLELVLEQAS